MLVRGLRSFRSFLYILSISRRIESVTAMSHGRTCVFLYKYMDMLNCGYRVYIVKEWTTTWVAAE